MTRQQAIKRAWQINNMLNNLRAKIDVLIDELVNIEDGEEYEDLTLRDLRYTLEDLRNFDLEDSIISAKD